MLREQVRWVVRAGSCVESTIAALEAVLHPEVADMKMSYLPQSASATNPNRRRGIRV